jgi:ABC-type branched-subunit amino acid transport system ATPase component
MTDSAAEIIAYLVESRRAVHQQRPGRVKLRNTTCVQEQNLVIVDDGWVRSKQIDQPFNTAIVNEQLALTRQAMRDCDQSRFGKFFANSPRNCAHEREKSQLLPCRMH